MRKLALLSFIFLAACAASAPMPVEGAVPPSAYDIAMQINAQPEDVQGLTCTQTEPGCHQCTYTLTRRTESSATQEPRADMVCNITGGWTVTPMSQIGS